MRNFFSNIQVSNLVYGSPIKAHMKKVITKGKALEAFLLDQNAQDKYLNNPFPKNDSEETKKELVELYNRTNSVSDTDLDFAIRAERNHFKEWVRFCMENGVIVHEYMFKEMEAQTDGLIYFLKNHYNRPRPFQLGFHLNVPIEPVVNHGANTAAYPSGHAFDAQLIALVLTSKYPNLSCKFQTFADKVAESRKNLGLHYQSDNTFGQELAKWVFSKQLF